MFLEYKLCLFMSHYRRAADKESHDEMSLDDHNPSLAFENNASATISDES